MVIIQILLNSVQFACIIALATLGIILIFKTSFTTNFAQGMIATIGAFISTYLITSYGVPAIPSMLISIAIMFFVGIVIDAGIFRRAKFMTPIGKQMITMGIVLFTLGIIPMIFGTSIRNAPKFSNEILRFDLFGANMYISWHALISAMITFAIITATFLALKFTKWGLAVRATASDETVARMMGINTTRITAMSWGLAAAFGSVGAIIYAPLIVMNPAMMVSIQVVSFMACILGGFGSFHGPIIGALLIPFLNNLIGYTKIGIWKEAVLYSIIFIIVLIKPVGLFGKKTIKKV